jgi:hypothetical protein
VQVCKYLYFGTDARWKVTAKIAGSETTETFDYLVVATGLFEKPFIPFEPSALAAFRGTVLHSFEVKSISDIKDKHVLIVGEYIIIFSLTILLLLSYPFPFSFPFPSIIYIYWSQEQENLQ